jgi:raffinose/stachyose/melibiose transport system permease protein
MKKKTGKNIIQRLSEFHLISFIVLSVYSFCIILPFVLLIYHSFRTRPDFLTNTLGIPQGFTVANYIEVFEVYDFHIYLYNSGFILVFTLAIMMALSLMASYALGRFNFKFRNGILYYFLLGLMFPIQLSIVPMFILIRNFGLHNTRLSAIIVLAIGISVPVLLMTGFFRKLPNSIYESAKIDGASEWRIFYNIMVPMASSAIFSICIIMSVTIWNQFFIPLIFLQSSAIRTVPLVLLAFTSQIFRNSDIAFAGSVVASVPLLIVFFIFSRRIIDGIMAGGIKG